MQKEARYYVYALVDADGRAFYIGKGTNGRTDCHFRPHQADHNTEKWEKIQKLLQDGMTRDQVVFKIAVGMEEDKALKLEKQIIDSVGLENLTNITEGGVLPSDNTGERNSIAKITRKEAAWIRYMAENSSFGGKSLFDHYRVHFESPVTPRIFCHINQGATWSHTDPVKPPFWDEQFERSRERDIEKRRRALVEWKTSDKYAKDVAEEFGMTERKLAKTWRDNSFGLKEQILEEHPELKKENIKERRYKALVEWRTSNKSAREVVEDFRFSKRHLRYLWISGSHGLKKRFYEEYPEFVESEEEKETEIERRYEALVQWKTTDKSAREVSEKFELTEPQICNAWYRNNFGLKDRFLQEHPDFGSKKKKKIERRFQALVEWVTTDKSAKQVAEEFGFAKHLPNIDKSQNTYELWDRFCREYPEYVN